MGSPISFESSRIDEQNEIMEKHKKAKQEPKYQTLSPLLQRMQQKCYSEFVIIKQRKDMLIFISPLGAWLQKSLTAASAAEYVFLAETEVGK